MTVSQKLIAWWRKKQNQSLFYLYSSDSSPRYQRNILDILCYPEGHIFRFRYQDKYVSDEIKSWSRNPSNFIDKLKLYGRKGIVIYAEKTGNSPEMHFNFFPVREVSIAQIKVEGSIYYVDIILGKFINYYSGLDAESVQDEIIRSNQAKQSLEKFRTHIKSINFYPLPKPNTSEISQIWNKKGNKIESLAPGSTLVDKTQGFYFSLAKGTNDENKPLDYKTAETFPNLAWESVVDVVSNSTSMKSFIFYRILGFYHRKRIWDLPVRWKDEQVKIKTAGATTVYLLPMGKTVTLKLLFYKSETAWEGTPKVKEQILEIKSNSDVFAGFSQNEIQILSRYNEELIQIACKRVFDSVFAPISIELEKSEEEKDKKPDEEIKEVEEKENIILAPQPYLSR